MLSAIVLIRHQLNQYEGDYDMLSTKFIINFNKILYYMIGNNKHNDNLMY